MGYSQTIMVDKTLELEYIGTSEIHKNLWIFTYSSIQNSLSVVKYGRKNPK